MTKVLSTICITTFNRAEKLKEYSLPSAITQQYHHKYEVIIIDDCSTDNTEEIVKQFQKLLPDIQIRYQKHDQNKGLAAARNTGVKLAQGKYIVFLDDDDVLIPYVLEVGTTLLDLYPNKKIVVGGRMVMYPEASQYQAPPIPNANTFYCTLDDGFMIRKEVFDDIQYDESLLTNEDADFGIQFMKKYGYMSFAPVNNCLLVKMGHEIGSPSSWSSPSERTYLGMERYMKKNLPLYYEHGDKNEIEYILRYMGRLYCQGGRMKQGISYLWKAWKTKPMAKNGLLLLFALGGKEVFNWYYRKQETIKRTKKL